MTTHFDGHSGCRVYYKDGEIVKQAGNYPLDRLRKQMRLHQSFYYSNRDNRIKIPRITKILQDGYHMEFIHSINMGDFLCGATVTQIDSLVRGITDFVNYNTRPGLWDASKNVVAKFNHIQERLKLDWLTERFMELYEEPIMIPYGRCHGDLTLDNLLPIPNSDCFGMIDFLDSYIESPVMDLVKLRQDTRHGWVTFRHELESSKANITLQYIDGHIPEQLKILEFMNLARILPYGNPKTTQFLKDAICRL